MMDQPTELLRRVAALDGRQVRCTPIDGLDPDLMHFIGVMAWATNTQDHTLLVVSAASADAILAKSRLLARLTETVPELVTGPLRFDSQYWVGTKNPKSLLKSKLNLSQLHFIGVEDAAVIEASTKPFDLGLFTATGVLGGQGMWRTYLDQYTPPNPPPPWHVWKVEPRHDAAVLEIASASQWVDFVLSYPLRERGLLFPDWKSVARHHDAIHVTLRAIAAIQGMYFATEQGLVAPSYWDVESTLWLRWCFDSVRLVEMVEPSPNPYG